MRDSDWRPTPCPTCGEMRHAAEHPVCDNCDSTPMGSVSLVKRQDVVKQATLELTDNDLILELRRRGRMGRIEVVETVPGHFVMQGMPLIYQVETAFKRIGNELFNLHEKGPRMQRMPGFMVEEGNFLSFLQGGDGRGGDRRVTVVLNYVKGKS